MQDATTWDAYTEAVVTIELPEGRLTVAPTDHTADGAIPVGLGEPVHVLTAWNPGSVRLGRDANDRRNRTLRGQLERRHATWFAARGCSPDGSWCEDGFAVTGWSRQDACALARAYEQAAVFELRTGRVAVVGSDLARVAARACTIRVDAPT